MRISVFFSAICLSLSQMQLSTPSQNKVFFGGGRGAGGRPWKGTQGPTHIADILILSVIHTSRCNSKRMKCASITKNNHLILCMEITALYCGDHMEKVGKMHSCQCKTWTAVQHL